MLWQFVRIYLFYQSMAKIINYSVTDINTNPFKLHVTVMVSSAVINQPGRPINNIINNEIYS